MSNRPWLTQAVHRNAIEGDMRMKDRNYLKQELYDRLADDPEVIDFFSDQVLDGIWYWDLTDREHEYMSDHFWGMLGHDPDEKAHRVSEWQNLIHPDDLILVENNFKKHLKDPDVPYEHTVRYMHKTGRTIWVKCKGFAIREDDGTPIRMLGIFMDITDMVETNKRIESLKDDYEKVFNGTQDALFLIDVTEDGQFRYIRNNTSHQQQTGISLEMIRGKTPVDLLGKDGAKEVIAHYDRCVKKEDVLTYEETLDLPAGERIWFTTLTPIIRNARVVHIVGSSRDITDQKRMEEELERRANYDMLTSLANRDHLTRKLDDFIHDGKHPFAFIFIDLDDFKAINDRYGHAAGDHVLKTVGKRLLSLIGDDDFAARLGGDEFVILKTCDVDTSDLEGFKQEIIRTLNQPMEYGVHKLNISAAVGYAKHPEDGDDYDTLSHVADHAMYAMKNHKKDKH